jgi:hypothetical protein
MSIFNSQSNQFRPETDNQIVNEIDTESHNPHDWKGIDYVWLVDGYIEGDLKILVSFRSANEECLAYFQHVPIVRGGKFGETKIEDATFDGDRDLAYSKKSGEQAVMLISDVEIVDRPQVTSLPALVRLDSPDSILRAVPHSLYLSSKRGFVNLGTLKNREHSVSSGLVSSSLDKMTNQVVEGASEAVNNISGNQGNAGINLCETSRKESVKSFVAGLRIRLGPDSIRVAFDESIFNDFKILEVCIGPFDFSSDERKSFIGGH